MKKIFMLLALAHPASWLLAQDGKLDQGFATNGISVLKNAGNKGDLPVGMFIASDGKNLQVGSSATDSNTHYLLIRRNEDGSPDNSFGNNGRVLADIKGKDGSAFSACELPNGKYMVAGNTLKGNFAKYNMTLMRFNKNGTVDSTFAVNGYHIYSIGDGNDYPVALLLQSDGKLIAAGYTSYQDTYVFFAARFNPDGSRDTSFGDKGQKLVAFGPNTLFVHSAALQQDGKILVVGDVQNDNYDFDYALLRLTSAGELDKTFGKGGRLITKVGTNNDFAYGVAVQPDKKIVVAGYYNAGNKANAAVVRYNEDGSTDQRFGTAGKATAALSDANVDAFALTLQTDNKILIAGTAAYLTGKKSDYAIFRLNTDGSADYSFGDSGKVITAVSDAYDGIVALSTAAKGKILAAGYSQNKTGISKMSEARYLIGTATACAVTSASDNIVEQAVSKLSLYPNPAGNNINIRGAWNMGEKLSISIYSSDGRLMLSRQYQASVKSGVINIPLTENFKAGNYFVKVQAGKIYSATFTVVK